MPKPTSSPLIYNANNGSHSEADVREYRYQRRHDARTVSRLDRFRKCGRTAHGQVTLGIKDGKAQQRGLYTCGSVWVCSVCSAKIMTQRQIEIGQAIDAWKERGGTFIFETLTLNHRSGDSVAKQRYLLGKAWESINKGRFSKKHEQFGQIGYLRSTEVTQGSNGPHVHFHVLRFVEGDLTEAQVAAWGDLILDKWSSSVQWLGGLEPRKEGHSFIRIDDAADLKGYFAKNFDNPLDSGTEERSTATWTLLSKAIASPNSKYAREWQDFERDSKGMKQLTWSRKIRAILGMGVEFDDLDIAREEEPYIPLIEVLPEGVKKFGSLGALQARVLRHIENGNVGFVLQILVEHGVPIRTLAAKSP